MAKTSFQNRKTLIFEYINISQIADEDGDEIA